METSRVIESLKQLLKSHDMTYADVASGLEMSEAGVKRMFSVERISLGRIEDICRLMNLELADLFRVYEESRHRVSQLTRAQEEELVNDTRLFFVTICVRNQMRFEDILKHFNIAEPDLIQCLARLDRLHIVDLLPGNLIRLRIAENFRWIPGGPIERYYEKAVQQEFLSGGFNESDSPRIFLGLLLSDASRAVVARRLDSLANEITSLHQEDSKLPFEQRKSVGILLASREWRFRAFESFSD